MPLYGGQSDGKGNGSFNKNEEICKNLKLQISVFQEIIRFRSTSKDMNWLNQNISAK